jgi:hypothetical protein
MPYRCRHYFLIGFHFPLDSDRCVHYIQIAYRMLTH